MLFPESPRGLESFPLLSRDGGPVGPWKEKSQGTMTDPRAPRFCPGGMPAGTHHSTPPSKMSLSPMLCPPFTGHTRPEMCSPEGDRLPQRGRTAILYHTLGGRTLRGDAQHGSLLAQVSAPPRLCLG